MTAIRDRDRLRDFIDVILASLDDDLDGRVIAKRACLSRYHFDRLVAAALGETPVAFRRRILLERAAWQLGDGNRSITDVALDAGYDSLEGFERAFGRSFGHAPGRHREVLRGHRLAAPNGIHFHPPGGLAIPGPDDEEHPMNLTDRLIDHDLWLTDRLIDGAATLPASDLDRPVWTEWRRLPFDSERPTVRSMLERIVSTKENWVASVEGESPSDTQDRSLEGLRNR